MKRIFIIGLLFLYAFTLYSQSNIRYYFKTLDIQDGLSQNTVNAILQDKQGFMWFGTKDGLNRFDGLSFRIFKKENSALGNNFITALHEDKEGNIWVGTDAGVYVYNPLLEDFTVFDRVSDTGDMISRAVTRIESDEDSDICEKYDVWKEKSNFGKKYFGIERTTFLIDEKGEIIKEWRKVTVKGHVDEILEIIKK